MSEPARHPTQPELLIEVSGLSKRFCRRTDRALRYGSEDLLRDLLLAPPRSTLREGEFWALQDVNLQVRRGDVVGLLGHNGAGKSTLLKLLAGIYRPTQGQITVHTHRIAVLDHAAGLNPHQTGRESIFTKLALLGLQLHEIEARVPQIVEMAELHEVIDAAISTYSTGMRVRLAFAMYASVEIDVFIIDDSMGVADIRFAQRMQRYWQDFVHDGGTILLATHEMYLMRALCTRALMFDHGRIVAQGDTESVIGAYLVQQQPASAEATAPGDSAMPAAPPTTTPTAATSTATTTMAEPEPPGPVDPGQARFARFARGDGFPVRILAITLESDPPAAASTAHCQGLLTVTVHCEAEHAVAQILMGVEFLDGDGQVALHLRGCNAPPHYALAAGPNRLRCTIGPLPLMPGDYTLAVGLVEQRTLAILGLCGFEDPGAPLKVLPHHRDDLLGAIARGARMTAPVRWQPAPALVAAPLRPATAPPAAAPAPSSTLPSLP